MKRTTRAWIGSTVTFLLFVLLGWGIGRLLGLEPGPLATLRWSLALLGLMASGIVARLLLTSGSDPIQDPPDDVSLAIDAAQARLARSTAKKSRIGGLPLVLLVGPRGSTKSTLLARTGLDPELLSGEVLVGDSVLPTEGVNLWYQDGTVYLEVGGTLLSDESRWRRLLRRIRPSSLGAAAGQGAQAPRSVLLCFGADEFLKPGAGETVLAEARVLRQRLAELCAELGISVPVYVFFTRSDRLPFFLDFIRTLKNDEVQDPLGVTLPIRPALDAGAHPREEGARIRAAFEELHASLGLNRLRVLPRETQDEVRSGAYEFPRELRKLSELATSFLVELSRPSQLGVTPVLRGFYFTGVRPILVQDLESSRPTTSPLPLPTGGATGVFNAQQIQAQAAESQPRSTGGRKVPQWVFVQRFFRQLLPADVAARALTAGGARVHLLRRLALGGAALLAFVCLLGFTVSFLGNRALATRIGEAAAAAAALPAEPGIPPSAADLETLDRLRAEVEGLRFQAADGPPLRLRWGLYQGTRLLPTARQLYFQQFDRLLWAGTRVRLEADIARMTGEPGVGDDYGDAYASLRAHLITTRNPERSEAPLLTPVLLRTWGLSGAVEGDVLGRVRDQFDFFARELPFGHPLPREADAGQLAEARAFLFRFAETDRVYQALLSEGSQGVNPVELARLTAASGGSLGGNHTVPGAFTEAGWERVQAALRDVDRLFTAEAWVVGEQAISAADRQRLGEELRTRYLADYVLQWQQFLSSATVPGFGSAGDAARRLDILSGNQSPLLQVLAITARNTAVDSAITPAFQPVHVATPPDVRDRFISDANQGYMADLADLQASMDQVASAPPAQRPQRIDGAASSADRTRRSVRQLAQAFSVEGTARVAASEVQRLMEAPVQYSEALLNRLPSAQLNARGESFCSAFTPVLALYPFNRSASQEVRMDDLEALFAPGQGLLWTFYDEIGRGLLVRQGSRWVAAPEASPRPTADFVSFFNQAAEVSRAFFGDQGNRAEVVFALRAETSDALPEVTVNLDGQVHRFTRTSAAAQTFVWQGGRAQNARVSGQLGGIETPLLEAPSGPWALFRLFGSADWTASGEGRYRVRWPIQGRQQDLTVEVTLPRGIPVFGGEFLRDLRCAPRIVQ